MADDPSATIATVDRYRSIVGAAIDRHGGRLHDFVGDDFLALFDDALSAISAAIEICTAIRSEQSRNQSRNGLRFRMGIASGEVMKAEDGQVFGDPVTIAARIQSITEPGGICVSDGVYLELDEPALRLRPLGAHRFKNVPGIVRVYRMERPDKPELALDRRLSDPTIAVLPVTSHPDLNHLAEAIRMDILTAMVKMPGLEVLEVDERSESEAAAIPDHPARYIVQAGILGSGQRLRVYVQLLDTPTVNRVWAHRWNGAVDEIFELQDRITHDVIRAVELELVIGAPAAIYRSLTDPVTVEWVFRGWHELGKGTAASHRRAVELFEQVHQAVPDIPLGSALSAFAHWYGTLAGLSRHPERDLIAARTRAELAASLGDSTGLSQMVRAALAMYDGSDLDSAIEEARAALEMRPTCDVTFGVEASIERYRGNWEAAVMSAQRAIALSPTRKPWYETTLAGAYYAGERYQEAADTAEPIAAHGGNLEAGLILAATQEALGLHRRAMATVEMIRAQFPDARAAELRRSHPFKDSRYLDRWLEHLAAAGMP